MCILIFRRLCYTLYNPKYSHSTNLDKRSTSLDLMNSKAEFFRLAGSTVVIEYKNKSIITAIRIIEFGEKTTKFILLNGDEVTIDNNQKLTRNSNGYIVIKA